MIKVEGLFTVVLFALWVYTLVEVFGTPEPVMRGLPKAGWVIVVLLLPLIGVIAWWVAGRPEGRHDGRTPAYQRRQPAFPEYDRPGRAAAVDPEKDADFLQGVRQRAEEQRRRYDEQRKRDRGDGDE